VRPLLATALILFGTSSAVEAALPTGALVLTRAETATVQSSPALLSIDGASYSGAEIHSAFVLGLGFPPGAILAYSSDGGLPASLDTSVTVASEMHVHHFDPTRDAAQDLLISGSLRLEAGTPVETVSGTSTIADLLSPAGSFLVVHVAVPEPAFGVGLLVGSVFAVGCARRKER